MRVTANQDPDVVTHLDRDQFPGYSDTAIRKIKRARAEFELRRARQRIDAERAGRQEQKQ